MVLYSTTNNGGPNVDMVSFTNEAVHRVGCPVVEVLKDSSGTQDSETGTTIAVSMQKNQTAFDPRNLTFRSAGGLAHIQIMNALGKTVVDETRMVSAGNEAILQGGARLSAGRYYLRIELDGKNAIFAHFAVSGE